MWENKKMIKWVYSLFQEIEDHFRKFQNACDANDLRRVDYYIKEIESKFFTTLDRKMKDIRKTHEIQTQYLLYKQQRYDIKKKNLPWD